MSANTETLAHPQEPGKLQRLAGNITHDWQTHLPAGIGLGALAYWTYQAERNGFNAGLPDGAIEDTANTLAHPVLGYTGTWTANKLAGLKRKGHDLKSQAYTFAGSTALALGINAAVEIEQSGDALPQYHWLAEANLDESGRDAFATLVGVGIYYATAMRRQRTKTHNA